MKKILTLLLLGGIVLSCAPRHEQMNVIRLELEGKRYDNLFLRLLLPDFEGKSIAGHSDDGYIWEFFYPDSLFDYISGFLIRVSGTPDSVRQNIGFRFVSYGDTVESVSLYFGRPFSLVKPVM